MIAIGARLAFDVVGVAGGWIPTTTDEVRTSAVHQLSLHFRVLNVQVRPQGAIYEMLEWPFIASVEVAPLVPYATIDDAMSVVANAFYESTGNLPTVTDAGAGLVQGGGIGNILDPITNGIGQLFSGIQNTTNLLLLLTAGVLIALVVSAGGKTTRIGLG